MDLPRPRPLLSDCIARVGGEDWVFERIENGTTVSALARALGISRATLSKWLNAPEQKKRFLEAQGEAAYALAEESQDIVDKIRPEREGDELAKARLQIDVRRDRVKILNPAAFDKNTSLATAENIGELLVAALSAVAKRHEPAQVAATTEPLETEVVVEQKSLPLVTSQEQP